MWLRKNIEFEGNPEESCEKYKAPQEELRNRIVRAGKVLPNVEMPERLLESICKACLDLKVDGMRPDIVISKAARTLAAFEDRTIVSLEDVLVASELALGHRTREGGFLEPASPDEIKKILMTAIKEVRYMPAETIQKVKEKKEKAEGTESPRWVKAAFKELGEARPKKKPKQVSFTKKLDEPSEKPSFGLAMIPEEKMRGIPTVGSAVKPLNMAIGISIFTKIKESALAPFKLFFKIEKPLKVASSSAGRRAETITTLHRGRPRGWRFPHGRPRDIHLPATIRAAARRQKGRETPLQTALKICVEDVREKLRLYKAPMTIVFVIDLSGSMIFSIKEVKEAMLKLHRDAYRYRDKVGIVALKETGAVVVQHPITNLRVVANKLLGLRISGHTPLAAGMLKALELLKEANRRDRSAIPLMVIITDGSANVPLKRSLETGEIREFDMVRIAVREFEDSAVRDVMAVSKMIRKQRIHTVVVNTNPHFYGRETYGLAVTQHIASATNGSHHEVGRLTHGEELVDRIFENLLDDQRLIAHEASLAFKSM